MKENKQDWRNGGYKKESRGENLEMKPEIDTAINIPYCIVSVDFFIILIPPPAIFNRFIDALFLFPFPLFFLVWILSLLLSLSLCSWRSSVLALKLKLGRGGKFGTCRTCMTWEKE